MGSTYQRTILLALVLAGALPVALAMGASLLVERHPELSMGDATTVTLAIAGLSLGTTILLAVGVSRALAEPLQTLREGLSTIVGSNRLHRLPLPAERDLGEMAAGINLLADQAAQATGDLDVRLVAATREIALEKATLESVLFAIVDGVVVCNEDLQIVLSNAAARRMLSQPARPLRRGESVFAYVRADLLRPLVDSLASRRNGSTYPAQRLERGALALPNGTVAEVSALVVGEEGEPRHHVLVLRDITEQVQLDRSRDRFLLEAVQRLRGPVAAVLSAAEILQTYDDLPADQRDAFLDVLHQDAERLAEDLDAMQIAAGGLSATQAGEAISIRDLAESAGAELEASLKERGQGLVLEGDDVVARGDRLALRQVVRQLVALVSARAPRGRTLEVRWRQVDTRLLELAVQAPDCEPFEDDTVFDMPLTKDERSSEHHAPSTIRSVVREHHGEVWMRHDHGGAALVLSLPVGEPLPELAPRRDEDAVGRQMLALVGEQGFYDPSPPVDRNPSELHARLSDLSYVVFDLETTGLGPGRGDKVVSIGAVRVRGGRLIPEDYFFSLVDPERPIPRSATRIHGITDEMVTGQPTLADVLPRFGEFVDGSVPVAHVASFDLQFVNPGLSALGRPPLGGGAVLDTLLLSCTLFPSWGNYNLEQIADRLGLTVVGRHTSLGDALTTAEILVRLLSVLEQRGIRALDEALKLQRGDAVSRLVETLRAKQSWG